MKNITEAVTVINHNEIAVESINGSVVYLRIDPIAGLVVKGNKIVLLNSTFTRETFAPSFSFSSREELEETIEKILELNDSFNGDLSEFSSEDGTRYYIDTSFIATLMTKVNGENLITVSFGIENCKLQTFDVKKEKLQETINILGFGAGHD